MDDDGNTRIGWVYAMQSDAFPHLIKIGATRAHPIRRARELSAGSGVPKPFNLVYYKDFDDCFAAETEAHRKLAHRRSNEKREFFEITIDEAVDTLNGLKSAESGGLTGGGNTGAGRVRSGPPVATPWAELFATFKPSDDPELTPMERALCGGLRERLAAGLSS